MMGPFVCVQRTLLYCYQRTLDVDDVVKRFSSDVSRSILFWMARDAFTKGGIHKLTTRERLVISWQLIAEATQDGTLMNQYLKALNRAAMKRRRFPIDLYAEWLALRANR